MKFKQAKEVLDSIGPVYLAGVMYLGCASQVVVPVVPDSVDASFMSDNVAGEFSKVYVSKGLPALTYRELKLLETFKDNPKELQNWINDKTKYMYDTEQFKNTHLCTPIFCDIWAPAAHFLFTGREDCDGVLAISHLSLSSPNNRGIILEGGSVHAVYVYEQNGLYGIISIGEIEYREPRYKSIDEAVKDVFKGRYEHYREVILPNDKHFLTYSYEIAKNRYTIRGKERDLK